MSKTRTIYRVDLPTEAFTPLTAKSASSLKVREKQIENWMVGKPELLFSDPSAVMVISREISGEAMADMLAVDSQGNLIIIEIKRHWSDRATVGQLLDYAAGLASWKYEDFNRRWKDFAPTGEPELINAFKAFIENPDFDSDDFLKERRLYILSAAGDESLQRIIDWLRDTYNVPIDFVPFQFYEDEGRLYLEISKIPLEPIIGSGTWAGDWFFNTNETHAPRAFQRMFADSVIAVYGYPDSEERLAVPEAGQRVFAYINGRGITAMGHVVEDKPFPANGVFGKQAETEYHRKVQWDVVLDPTQAISPSQVGGWGYNLPIRSTLCKIRDKKTAERIAEELAARKARKKATT